MYLCSFVVGLRCTCVALPLDYQIGMVLTGGRDV